MQQRPLNLGWKPQIQRDCTFRIPQIIGGAKLSGATISPHYG